jgi:hypothetical protein
MKWTKAGDEFGNIEHSTLNIQGRPFLAKIGSCPPPLSRNRNLTETQPSRACVLLGTWKRADITDTGCPANWRMNFGTPTRCLAKFATRCRIAGKKPLKRRKAPWPSSRCAT